MILNIEKLENIKYRDSRLIARCPACTEQGNDNKGNHLVIYGQGQFSCIRYPGNAGVDHRKRIFALIGIKTANCNSHSFQQKTVIKVKAVDRNTGNVIKSNVLGHLGRVNQTLKKHNENDNIERIYNKDFEKGVPSVPTTETVSELHDVTAETKLTKEMNVTINQKKHVQNAASQENGFATESPNPVSMCGLRSV